MLLKFGVFLTQHTCKPKDLNNGWSYGHNQRSPEEIIHSGSSLLQLGIFSFGITLP